MSNPNDYSYFIKHVPQTKVTFLSVQMIICISVLWPGGNRTSLASSLSLSLSALNSDGPMIPDDQLRKEMAYEKEQDTKTNERVVITLHQLNKIRWWNTTATACPKSRTWENECKLPSPETSSSLGCWPYCNKSTHTS